MIKLRGYFFIAAAALCWGGSAVLAKFLFSSNYNPLIIVQMRVTIAFVLLTTYFAIKNRTLLKFNSKDIPLFFFVGVCGVAGSNYFYYFAIRESSVALSILVQYSAPVMVAVYAWLFQKEQMTKYKVSALVLSIVGIFLAVGGFDPTIFNANINGVTLATIAAVSFAIFNIAGKSLTRKYSAWTSLIYVLGAASIFWMFVNTPAEIINSHYSVKDWLVFVVISTTSILIPYSFYFFGLHYIQPSKAIITSTLEPIFAIIFEWIFLSGSLGGLQLIGAVFVLTAILLLQFRSHNEEVTIAQE